MRVFWKRREREKHKEWSGDPGPLVEQPQTSGFLTEGIELHPGISRATSISRVAEELWRRGEEVVEIFKEVVSPEGRADLPIHLRRGSEDIFIEVETGSWDKRTVGDVLKTVAILRGSEYSDAVFEVLGSYSVPEKVRYLSERSPAALFQLDLVGREEPEDVETCAEAFKNTAERHWNLDLDYDPEELPLIEELLLKALDEGSESGERAPVLDGLTRCFGCYMGETLRRHAAPESSWRSVADWGEDFVVEFPHATADPIGQARAALENGLEDSAAYYVRYALKELNG